MWRSMNDFNTGSVPDNSDVFVNISMLGYGTTMQVQIDSWSPTFGVQEHVIQPSFPQMSRGVWHRLGLRLKKNTFNGSTPNNDGEMEVFIDGTSRAIRTGIRTTALASRWFRDYTGGPLNYTSTVDNNPIPADQTIRVDNFKITDLTGPLSVPPPPTGLIVQ
jgi:hypothetical protein